MSKIDMSKKYRYVDGTPCRVLCVDRKGAVHPAVLSMSELDGSLWMHDEFGCHVGTPTTGRALVEVGPYDHLEVDDPVITCPGGFRRYFSHVGADGKPHCFADGRTSWSSGVVAGTGGVAFDSVERADVR